MESCGLILFSTVNISVGCKQDISKQDFLKRIEIENVKVAHLKAIPLEASFSCASDGAIDKPHGVK